MFCSKALTDFLSNKRWGYIMHGIKSYILCFFFSLINMLISAVLRVGKHSCAHSISWHLDTRSKEKKPTGDLRINAGILSEQRLRGFRWSGVLLPPPKQVRDRQLVPKTSLDVWANSPRPATLRGKLGKMLHSGYTWIMLNKPFPIYNL